MQVIIDKVKTVYQGFFTVQAWHLQHELFAGGLSPPIVRECFRRADAAGVLAFDPIANKVVLLEQFRIGAKVNDDNPWVMEIIAGLIEPGQQPHEVAIREACEEAGCEILALEPICQYYTNPGSTSEVMHLFCGMVDSRYIGGIHGLPEEGEDIKVHVLDYDQVISRYHQGQINNAFTLISLQWLILNHQRLRAQWGSEDRRQKTEDRGSEDRGSEDSG